MDENNQEKIENIPVETSKSEEIKKKHSLSPLWKIPRAILLLLSVWSFFFYWWNIFGILYGVALVAFSKDKVWRRHGAVVAFSIGVGAWLLDQYRNNYYALLLLAFLLYVVIIIVVGLIMQIISLIRKNKKAKKNEKAPRLNSKVRLAIKVAVIIAPILIWSTVSINFGVMFSNKTQMLWINGPSMANAGDELTLTVEAWDDYERLSASYKGNVEFSIQSYNLTTGDPIVSPIADVPNPYTFTGKVFSGGFIPAYELSDNKDFGMKTFNIRINTTGIHYILVEDSLTGNTYWSNPIIVDNYPDGTPKLAWGDIHGHTMVSDGSGTVEHAYEYAKNVALLEFCSVTDHGEHLNLNGWAPEGSRYFDNYIKACNDANDPGSFVALQGAEWTTNYAIQPIMLIPVQIATGGHYTMVFSGDDLPLFAGNVQATPDALWDVLDDYCAASGEETIAVPHHTIRDMFIQDWTYLNPDYVRLAEVTSVHGEDLYNNASNYIGSVDTTEPVNGSSIIDALNMGYRMTFIASGDNHDGHPGHSLSHTEASVGHQWPFSLYNARNGHPYPSGITAVYSSGLTRSEIFDSLQNGRVYANSDFGRPVMNFTINGVEVGYNSTLTVPSSTADRNISIFIALDGAPAATMNTGATVGSNWVPNWNARVEIIKNGGIWRNYTINSPISYIDFTDNLPIAGASYDGYIELDSEYYLNDQSANPVNPADLNTGGADYYAVRVVGANGRTSYIGPIWVEVL